MQTAADQFVMPGDQSPYGNNNQRLEQNPDTAPYDGEATWIAQEAVRAAEHTYQRPEQQPSTTEAIAPVDFTDQPQPTEIQRHKEARQEVGEAFVARDIAERQLTDEQSREVFLASGSTVVRLLRAENLTGGNNVKVAEVYDKYAQAA